ncbi:isocitrate lyase/PEP mutase family protein [Verticiella sediminum]|uniref:Isocitrate lyase/PEP mutase family protein n=1 Tax=Verticiella sediminum TaxID=1247510 RepID=A0A556B340_9BURK|nr:isocitrate lyase/PEP mutase family protein [Verticiella sediminum]TSH99275.1 isocitrate lyase/PEP mutase family protein [Verticiella sediminum]
MRLRPLHNDVKPSTAFRKALTEGPLPAVGIWGGTAHHAQLAEEAGFEHFGVSGAATTTQLLGLPDAGLITLPELVENVRRICQAVSIPVVVDCDTGFGNAINVIRTVEEVIRAGAAGLFIEDQVAPKRCGFVKGKELIPIEEAVGKYRAACDTRDRLDKDVIIMARTDARGAIGGGMEEVFRRGRAYLDAGVDVLYVEALQTREEIRQVREAFPDALLKCTTQAIKPGLTNEEVRELRLVTMGQHISRVGSIAMYDFLLDYRKRGETAANEFTVAHEGHPLAGFGVFDLTGFPQVHTLEQRYLPEDHMERYEHSVGVYDPRKNTSKA